MMKGGGGGGGEMIQMVRKDRHSKVYTSKGPRDRRVRLSAHTAIQFYDVQDRLGYDRPSKAVDWLINKAKDAIDRLEELPPWNPSNTEDAASASSMPLQHEFQLDPIGESSSLAAPQIGDSMTSSSLMMNFQGYPHGLIISRPAQDLGLSLHSMQEQESRGDHKFTATTPTLPFEVLNYAKNSSPSCWTTSDGNDEENREGGGGGGFAFGSQHPLFVPQRESLQSNNNNNNNNNTYSHLIHHAWNINHQNSTIGDNNSHFRLPASIQSQVQQQQPPGPVSHY